MSHLRLRTALAWLAAAAALLPLALSVEDRLEVRARILGSESAAVERLLAEKLDSPFARNAILVLSGVPTPDKPEGRAVLDRVAEALAKEPGVTGTFSYRDQPDDYFVGASRHGTFVVVGLEAPDGRVDRLLPALRRASTALEAELRALYPGATLRWTGEAALNYDLWRSSADDTHSAERRTLPIALSLLVFAFGSLVAALLTLASGALAVGLALGLLAVIARHWSLSILAINVVSMLGLALGIDYALLTVSRFREARRNGAEPERAGTSAARHAGRTVALSGITVAVGFLALLLVPLAELRSAVLGGLLVAVVSVLVAATLVPGTLAWLGPRLERWRLRPAGENGRERWRAWSRRVSARPWTVLLVTGLPLLALAAQAARLHPHIPSGDWLPRSIESARGIADLRAMGRAGVVESLRVVLELPETTSALGREGWEAQRRLVARLAADPRVARVQSLPTIAGDRADDLAYVALLPAAAKRAFLGPEGDIALVEAVPRETADPEDVAAFVRELRKADTAALTGIAGARLHVGGLPAFNADYEDAVSSEMPLVVGLVIAARSAEGGRPQPARGVVRLRRARPRLPGRPRRAAARPRRPPGRRLPHRPRPRLLHRLRPEHGLRGVPRRAGGGGATGRHERRRGDRGGARPHRRRHHERRRHHDRGLRRLRPGELRPHQDAGLRTGGGGAGRRHRDPRRDRPGAPAPRRPLELVARRLGGATRRVAVGRSGREYNPGRAGSVREGPALGGDHEEAPVSIDLCGVCRRRSLGGGCRPPRRHP
jgi:RND superfamily putative drug exporter